MRKRMIASIAVIVILVQSAYSQTGRQVWIFPENVTIAREGTKPVLSVFWKAFDYDSVQNISKGEISESQIQFVFTIVDVESESSKPQIKINNISAPRIERLDISKLRQKHSYKFAIFPQTQGFVLFNSTSNFGTFQFRRNCWDNAVCNFLRALCSNINQELIIPFHRNGPVFEVIFIFLILALFANTLVFILRLYYRVKGLSDVPRIFPKNEKRDLRFNLMEFSRFITFSNYGKRLEFVQKLEKGKMTAENLESSIDLLEKTFLKNLLISILELYRTYKGKGKWYRDRYIHKRYDQILWIKYQELKGLPVDKVSSIRLLFTLDTFWILAVVAPLLGLLGTVIGISGAFNSLTYSATALGDIPTQLAANINLALYTTIYGLIIGMISLLFYHYFKSQIESSLRETDRIVSQVYDLLKKSKD